MSAITLDNSSRTACLSLKTRCLETQEAECSRSCEKGRILNGKPGQEVRRTRITISGSHTYDITTALFRDPEFGAQSTIMKSKPKCFSYCN